MKIGTIGTSSITQQFIKTVNQMNGVSIKACCSRSIDRSRALALVNGVQRAYDQFEVMCQSGLIDTVYIGIPNHLHFEYAKKAINLGLNVIVEKPFTSNYREAEKLVKLAKRKKVFLFEAITMLYDPAYQKLKSFVKEVQDIKFVQANYSQRSSKLDKALQGEYGSTFDLNQSGGALMDLNVYNLHAIIDIFGKPNYVSYTANFFVNGVDTSGVALLHYEDKIAISIAAKDSASPSYFTVQGNNGYVSVNGSISVGDKIDINILNREENYIDRQLRMKPEISAFKEMIDEKNYDLCYRYLDHSLNVMKVLDDLRKSANIVFPADQ